jgi:O-antigen/teichoic acid export membrane protein
VSRAGKIVRAVSIGYGFQVVTAATGLVLTPFLLSRLGAEDYGRWLVVGQVLGLLGLLDLGVTAVLPREVGRASGSGGAAEVAEVARRAVWLVWLQTPVAGAVTAAVWAAVAAARPELAGPLAVILAGFVVQFPLRVPAAVLSGLQDLEFVGAVQAAGWAVTTVTTVGLVFAGSGLYALAAGWAVGQLTGCGGSWVRLRLRFPHARARRGWPGRASLSGYLGPSFWTSARQLVLLLLNGVDLILLGWLAGPAAVVLYACTVKVVALVNNQPYLLATSALPAVAELVGTGDRERLWRASRAVGTGLLILSGGLALAVVAVNGAFVPRWVGPGQYAGPLVTLLAVVAMVLRHWSYNLGQTMYALGAERQLTLVAAADSLLTVAATVGWVWAFGVVGVPLGSITGLLLTNGPFAVVWLGRAAGVGPLAVLGWNAPWALRFAAVLAPVAAVSFTPAAATAEFAAGLLAGGIGAYALALWPLFRRDPLREYTRLLAGRLTRRPRPSAAPAVRHTAAGGTHNRARQRAETL